MAYLKYLNLLWCILAVGILFLTVWLSAEVLTHTHHINNNAIAVAAWMTFYVFIAVPGVVGSLMMFGTGLLKTFEK